MRRDYSGKNNPHYGKPGKNQYSNIDWNTVDWNSLSYRRKRLILLQNNAKCSVCDFDKIREDGFSILEIDHIDGNHLNNDKQNLRVVCPNCHALTSKYWRNCGNKKNIKRSTRIRKGNKIPSSSVG